MLPGAASDETPPEASAGGNSFHCALDPSCPEILVVGDPHAEIGGNPAPFRGYGDPSLEYDPDTGDLWMTYSWLDVLISDPGPPPVVDFGVRTHLARSTDGGATWTYVREMNSTVPISHPDSSAQGWTIHEVSTLARRGPGDWEALWLTYFDPYGPPQRSDYYYARSVATTPEDLGDTSTPWIRTNSTSASWGAVHNLSAMPELADCTVLTEAGLFTHGGETYLMTNCVVFDGVRQPEEERLVLLREEAAGYSYAGILLDYDDAVDLGGERVEQADLAVAQNGAVLLIVTPIQAGQPEHLGCVVLEVTDIANAEVRRDGSGDAVRFFEITGEDPIHGAGLCAYDAQSESGVLMVLHDFTPSPFDMEFSLRATGIHPLGLDTDGDGLADTADANDDNDAFTDALETACGSDPLNAASRPERIDGAFAGGDDDGDAAIDEGLPGGSETLDCDGDGFAGTVEAHVFASGTRDQDPCGTTAWAADLIGGAFSGNLVNVQDLATFLGPVRYLNTDVGTNPGDARFDVLPGATFGEDINIQDLAEIVVFVPPMLGVRAFNGPECPWAP